MGFNFGVNDRIYFGLRHSRSGDLIADVYASFTYQVGQGVKDYYGVVITVPKGFETDFASIPRFFWTLLPPLGRYANASVLHDFLYATKQLPRKIADLIFLEAMLKVGVNPIKAYLMYYAVRLFGPRFETEV